MAVEDNRHWRVRDSTARHWLQSYKAAGADPAAARRILAELAGRMAPAIEEVSKRLPKEFPESVFAATVSAIRSRKAAMGRD